MLHSNPQPVVFWTGLLRVGSEFVEHQRHAVYRAAVLQRSAALAVGLRSAVFVVQRVEPHARFRLPELNAKRAVLRATGIGPLLLRPRHLGSCAGGHSCTIAVWRGIVVLRPDG